jgi:hypothetical protein
MNAFAVCKEHLGLPDRDDVKQVHVIALAVTEPRSVLAVVALLSGVGS